MRINDYIKRKSPEVDKSTSNEEMVGKYSQMSEEQLMQEMFRSASQSRSNGTLNDEMLDGFYNQAQGFLSPEQSERMKDLIRELKK